MARGGLIVAGFAIGAVLLAASVRASKRLRIPEEEVEVDEHRPSQPEPSPPPRVSEETPPVPAAEYSPADRTALSYAIASESSDGSNEERTWIAWCVRNQARVRNLTIEKMLGALGRAQRGNDPPFATSKKPARRDVELAISVLAKPQSEDPTSGSTAFFEPALQDLAVRYGEMYRKEGKKTHTYMKGGKTKTVDLKRFEHYHKTAAVIRAEWGKGDVMVRKVGRMEFWRPMKRSERLLAAAKKKVEGKKEV